MSLLSVPPHSRFIQNKNIPVHPYSSSSSSSTLTDTRPPCFEVEKHALRLGASAHYLPTNLGPSPLSRTPFEQVTSHKSQQRESTRSSRPFFPLGWQVTRVQPYLRRPFSFNEIRRISDRDVLGPPVVPGGQGIGLGSRTLERAGR
jgi:hypothetical protein